MDNDKLQRELKPMANDIRRKVGVIAELTDKTPLEVIRDLIRNAPAPKGE